MAGNVAHEKIPKRKLAKAQPRLKKAKAKKKLEIVYIFQKLKLNIKAENI